MKQTGDDMPDPREWAKKIGDEGVIWREGNIRLLMRACYLHAASVAREHDCESGNSWCPCRVAEQLDRLAAEIERGE